MKVISPQFISNEEGGNRPIYLQLYDYIIREILNHNMVAGEKLPSLRSLAKSLQVSVTTVEQAYSQLLVEGYISSRPQSGYYINDLSFALGGDFAYNERLNSTSAIKPVPGEGDGSRTHVRNHKDVTLQKAESKVRQASKEETKSASSSVSAYSSVEELLRQTRPQYLYDLNCFDFNKWKKCASKVLTEFTSLLTTESDPHGEEALRQEIARYVYQSRGVSCSKNQIVIGAGTQQITVHLSRILQQVGINHVAVEEPGYLPVKNILKERGFVMTPVEVGYDGIDIAKLPANIRSAVYVCPSNQFPTGAVMPIGRRYELLDWANRNDSIIIEDDYDSELRYFGRPIPALQGLDQNQRVVYLGSFSSTLFPAIKISYMVLTPQLTEIFNTLISGYTQTCSKTEQLTLALFMSQGYYQSGIRKLRNLYSQKLQVATAALSKQSKGRIELQRASSGLNIILKIDTSLNANELCEIAEQSGIPAVPVAAFADSSNQAAALPTIVFYYHQIPLEDIDGVVENLVKHWLA